MDDKSTATKSSANAKDRKRKKRERPIEVQRRLDIDDLPRDEDGKVILPEDITYAEFIRLTHPEMSDAEVEKTVRKEERSAKITRIELAAFIVLILFIIILIITS